MSAVAKLAIRDQVEAALALRSAGRLQEALDALTTPGEYISDFYTVRGEIQFALGRYEEAAGSYYTVVTTEPDNTFAHYHLALCLRYLRNWEAAARSFQKVIESDPHRDDARLALGGCLLNLNRAEEALAHFDRCWSDAARKPALFGKAAALQLLRRFAEAEAAYKRVLENDPKSAEALSNLVALCVEARDSAGAHRYARRLLENYPQSTIALQGMAAAALEQHEYEAAARYCSRIVERDPDCLEAWHNLRFATGRVMSALGISQAAGAPVTEKS
jgi:tetratricopeptide (TPR) repeat protein